MNSVLASFPRTRREVLALLKRRGSSTTAELATDLGMTHEGVRSHVVDLLHDGWISRDRSAAKRDGSGRPAVRYQLTVAGDHLFPKQYERLADAFIDPMAAEVGVEAAMRVLARVTSDRVTAVAPTLEGLALEERLDVLKGWYAADDPYMSVERDGSDYRLIERNCPFYNTAMNRPALCSVSVNALTQLLGVRVHREEKFQNGDGRCVFRVHANEPVTDARFTLES